MATKKKVLQGFRPAENADMAEICSLGWNAGRFDHRDKLEQLERVFESGNGRTYVIKKSVAQNISHVLKKLTDGEVRFRLYENPETRYAAIYVREEQEATHASAHQPSNRGNALEAV